MNEIMMKIFESNSDKISTDQIKKLVNQRYAK